MRRGFALLCALAHIVALMSFATSVKAINPFVETQTVTVANAHPVEGLGESTDVSGGLAISGAINGVNSANQTVGAAYIFRQSPAGEWNQVAKLLPSNGQNNASFGGEVAISGDWAMVEANFYGHSTSPYQYGATYFFHRNSDNDWQETNIFLAPPYTTSYSSNISLDGTHAVLSSKVEAPLSRVINVVDVFELSNPSSWQKTQRIEYPGQINDVVVKNGMIAIGGYKSSTPSGSTIFSVELYQASATGFTYSSTILGPATAVAFGNSIAIDDDRMLIGASSEAGHGAAYIYERASDGSWLPAAHLVPSNIDQRFRVGIQVALHDDFAFVSATNSSFGYGDGSVSVFQRNASGSWLELGELNSPYAQSTFGRSLVAINGQVLIGSGVNRPGAIHVFSQVPEPTAHLLLMLGTLSGFATHRRRRQLSLPAALS
jgi:hypothetical protein